MPPVASARPIGVHTSIAGGLHLGLVRAGELGCSTVQIFSRNPRGWHAAKITPEASALFIQTRRELGIAPVYIHTPYLLNIASPDGALRERSVLALRDEMLRADAIGAEYVVLHTGTAHDGQGRERAAQSIVEALEGRAINAGLLLENTSGKRGDVTPRVEDLAFIMRSSNGLVAGVCLDTCHAHAAGYDLATDSGREQLTGEAESLLGAGAVRLIHLNDSKGECGSGLDRHAHIGQGRIGLEALGEFLNNPLIQSVPIVLETPKDTPEDDPRNLDGVRKLLADIP